MVSMKGDCNLKKMADVFVLEKSSKNWLSFVIFLRSHLLTYHKEIVLTDWLIRPTPFSGGWHAHVTQLVLPAILLCCLHDTIYKNGKRRSCSYISLLMHLGGLLSTQEARVARGDYASFVVSNFLRASITRCDGQFTIFYK